MARRLPAKQREVGSTPTGVSRRMVDTERSRPVRALKGAFGRACSFSHRHHQRGTGRKTLGWTPKCFASLSACCFVSERVLLRVVEIVEAEMPTALASV